MHTSDPHSAILYKCMYNDAICAAIITWRYITVRSSMGETTMATMSDILAYNKPSDTEAVTRHRQLLTKHCEHRGHTGATRT